MGVGGRFPKKKWPHRCSATRWPPGSSVYRHVVDASDGIVRQSTARQIRVDCRSSLRDRCHFGLRSFSGKARQQRNRWSASRLSNPIGNAQQRTMNRRVPKGCRLLRRRTASRSCGLRLPPIVVEARGRDHPPIQGSVFMGSMLSLLASSPTARSRCLSRHDGPSSIESCSVSHSRLVFPSSIGSFFSAEPEWRRPQSPSVSTWKCLFDRRNALGAAGQLAVGDVCWRGGASWIGRSRSKID
jgi:hypothetical protein